MIGENSKNINPDRACAAEIFGIRLVRGTLAFSLRAACNVAMFPTKKDSFRQRDQISKFQLKGVQ